MAPNTMLRKKGIVTASGRLDEQFGTGTLFCFFDGLMTIYQNGASGFIKKADWQHYKAEINWFSCIYPCCSSLCQDNFTPQLAEGIADYSDALSTAIIFAHSTICIPCGAT
jgi:hypothetical protein